MYRMGLSEVLGRRRTGTRIKQNETVREETVGFEVIQIPALGGMNEFNGGWLVRHTIYNHTSSLLVADETRVSTFLPIRPSIVWLWF